MHPTECWVQHLVTKETAIKDEKEGCVHCSPTSLFVQVACDVNTRHVKIEEEYFALSQLLKTYWSLLSAQQCGWYGFQDILFSEAMQSYVSCFSDHLCLCFTQGNVKDFQLWVISKRDNVPYPLIGQWVKCRPVWENITRSCCIAWFFSKRFDSHCSKPWHRGEMIFGHTSTIHSHRRACAD